MRIRWLPMGRIDWRAGHLAHLKCGEDKLLPSIQGREWISVVSYSQTTSIVALAWENTPGSSVKQQTRFDYEGRA